MAPDLAVIARRFAEHPGLRAKQALHIVAEALGPTDWVAGPGDDAAALPGPDGTFQLVAGEAIWPPFVEADPYGAGVAAVVANVNDIAAMGGRTTALIDTVTGREPALRQALAGLRHAADRYGVPVVGGHLGVWEGPPSLSVFAFGHAGAVLSARNVAPGQSLLAAYCLDGTLRGDFPFFSSISARGADLAADVGLLADLATEGWLLAAKDISMAGTLGSLAMLLEPTGCGAAIQLDGIPRPPGVALEEWVFAFPTFGFLLTCRSPDVAPTIAAFAARGLSCAAIGTIDATGLLRGLLGGDEVTLIDLTITPVTGLLRR